MWIGIFLICVGILYILNNMGILRGDVWDYALPIFFILLGGSIIIKRIKKNNDTRFTPGHQGPEDNQKDKSPGAL